MRRQHQRCREPLAWSGVAHENRERGEQHEHDVAPSERIQEQRQRQPGGEHASSGSPRVRAAPIGRDDSGGHEQQRGGREGGARQPRCHDDRPREGIAGQADARRSPSSDAVLASPRRPGGLVAGRRPPRTCRQAVGADRAERRPARRRPRSPASRPRRAGSATAGSRTSRSGVILSAAAMPKRLPPRAVRVSPRATSIPPPAAPPARSTTAPFRSNAALAARARAPGSEARRGSPAAPRLGSRFRAARLPATSSATSRCPGPGQRGRVARGGLRTGRRPRWRSAAVDEVRRAEQGRPVALRSATARSFPSSATGGGPRPSSRRERAVT